MPPQSLAGKGLKVGTVAPHAGAWIETGTFAAGGAVVKKHTVRKGQTWESIAAAYSMPVKTLRAANPQIVKYQRLKEGDVLTIG